MTILDECKTLKTRNLPRVHRAARHGPGRVFRFVAGSLVAAFVLSATPAMAQNLGLTIDQLIERIGRAADAAGTPLEFQGTELSGE